MLYTYKYPRPALTVDCIVFLKIPGNEYKVLLIQRNQAPYEGKWAFPGGFVDINETLETAANRELEEETGLKNIKLKQLYTFDAINRDPRHRTISVVYWGKLDHEEKIYSGSDARKVKWFSINEIPELAFDHNHILDYAFKVLQL
ncbi:MAG: NUDIX hydrolase [Bacteroidales bacterium]|nr:NUDIX hydrolase [Bacteroidales bacterium]